MIVKYILRCLKGIVGYGIRHSSYDHLGLHGYADADWGGTIVDRKRTSGCCFYLGSRTISWISRKQTLVAHST